MSTNQLMFGCAVCGKQTLHIKQTPNHILHLLLSIITFGIWIIIWILIAIKIPQPECTICGTRADAIKKDYKHTEINTKTKFALPTWIIIGLFVVMFLVYLGGRSDNQIPTTPTSKVIKDSDPETKEIAYEIGNAIILSNPFDKTFALYGDNVHNKVIKIFVNDTIATIMDYHKEDNNSILYKVQILQANETEYIGWIRDEIIKEVSSSR